MFSCKSSLDLKMFLNYAKCDLIKFTWGISPGGFCPGGGGGGRFVLEPNLNCRSSTYKQNGIGPFAANRRRPFRKGVRFLEQNVTER